MNRRIVAVLVVLIAATTTCKDAEAMTVGGVRKLLQGGSAVTPQQTVKTKCTTTVSDATKMGVTAAAAKSVPTKPGAAAQVSSTARPAGKPATQAGRPSAAKSYTPLVVMGPTPRTEERFKIGGEDGRGIGK